MNQPSSKPDQPKFVAIYSALALGFIFLLTLIWLIGSRGVDELQKISDTASETSADFQKRLALAGRIRDDEVNIIAQARVVRATRHRPIPFPPFTITLNEAKLNFLKTMADAKKLWGTRAEQQNLKPEELKYWREVEVAAPEFLDSLERLALAKEKTEDPEENAAEQNPERIDSNENLTDLKFFSDARKKLDEAVTNLSNTIYKDQSATLDLIAKQQLQAAAAVSQTRWGAFFVGVFVAAGVFLIMRNRIADLRRAIRTANDAQDFARSVFDSQSNDILVITENGDVSAVNQAFFKHFNLKRSELLLQDYRSAFAHLPEVSAFIQKTLKLSEKNTARRERIEVRPKRGLRQSQNFPTETRLFDVYLSPLTINHETRGRVVVLVDVTEAEQVREELRRNRTLSAVGQITAQVAHELYNPIGAVKLNIELLEMQMSGADDDLKHTVARLKRGADHLSTIVMDLRYLTRPRDPELKTTNLNSLLDEVVELASDRLERARTVIVRQYAAGLPPGRCDPQQLRKVFLNLLINAVEASPANSEVELQTKYLAPGEATPLGDLDAQRGTLAVCVVDHGSGMSEETRQRLFEAFYTTKRNGTGLGMMITQEIVKKHGGKIEVESEEGKGTTVSVYLPA